MITARLLSGAIVAAGLSILWTATGFAAQAGQVGAAGPSTARFPRNAEEFDQMFNQIKNYGHSGPDDQLGAANLIADEKRRQAFALAKLGRVISLGRPLPEPTGLKCELCPKGNPFEHTMMDWGFTTNTAIGSAADTYTISSHGLSPVTSMRCATSRTRDERTTVTLRGRCTRIKAAPSWAWRI